MLAMPAYQLSINAVMETFDTGGLILSLPERRVVELNPTAVEIIRLLDGKRTLGQVAADVASKFGIELAQASDDVKELCEGLYKSGILTRQSEGQEKEGMTISPGQTYLRNPDVVLREEDPNEGGLLFNPDTNQVKVINTTGLFIWQQCGVARNLAEIIAEVKKGFDEVPSEQVDQDVKEFVDDMLTSGFIGIVKQQ